MAITGLAGGLESLGHSVHQVGPLPDRPNALGRLRYNLRLARAGGSALPDSALVVGFDVDGFALRPRSKRYVVCLKGVMADELRFERGWPRLRFRLLSRLEAANARSADVVTVTSEYSRRVAIDSYGLDAGRVRVVPEGIDLHVWCGSRPATPAPMESGALVLSVARQYRRKNTAALLQAMPAVRAAVPEARLRIVGGGPELPRLERQRRSLGLSESVTITGELPGAARIREEYRAADIFCLPSLQEGFGIVFLEAMASGLPVVACRSAAVPEVVPDGEAGLLVPPGEPESLADALIRLLSDGPLRQKMGEAGRRRARDYGWKEVARRFLSAAGF